MVVYYRISDGGYSKVKPDYITKENCLANCYKVFMINPELNEFVVIADKVSDTNVAKYQKIAPKATFVRTNYGYGNKSYLFALEMALKREKNEIVYLVEDDYLHLEGSYKIINEGLDISDYVSLYDHPDKYMARCNMGNPFVEEGGENTKVLLTKSTHWKITNSTPMTFAAKVSTLLEDYEIHRHYCEGTMSDSFRMFLRLAKNSRKLVTPIPSWSTHGETQWLAPLIAWHKVK